MIIHDLYRYQRQFLVHSFLYYKLNESLIPDDVYDQRCKIMVKLIEENLELSATLPYHDLCVPCGQTGSGYYINDYPQEIITTALHLLHYSKRKRGLDETFPQFISRWGYHIE